MAQPADDPDPFGTVVVLMIKTPVSADVPAAAVEKLGVPLWHDGTDAKAKLITKLNCKTNVLSSSKNTTKNKEISYHKRNKVWEDGEGSTS